MEQEIKIGDIVRSGIKLVRLHKEERYVIGESGSSYSSCYLAVLDCTEEIVVDIDRYAERMHPEWEKRTDNRADVLTKELKGKEVECEIFDFCPPKSYEGKLIRII